MDTIVINQTSCPSSFIKEEEMGVLLISQSGETRDILSHIKDIQNK